MTSCKPAFRSLRIAAIAAATLAAAGAHGANIGKATYDSAKDQLKAQYKAERDTCSTMSGNAKDICVETAKGREKVALAHLEVQRSGSAGDQAKLMEARYEARYELAKEVCDDQTGQAKDQCQATAKAERDKAKADTKMTKQVREARDDARETKDKADYKVAIERCDGMAGNAKDSCSAAARARYNQ